MITKEDADNLESENPKELVDIICTQSELIDDLYSQLKKRDEEIERLKEQLKAKDDEIRRLNNLYADTIKDLGDALIEIEMLKEQLKIDLNEPLKSITINQMSGGKDEY